jgi:hypothetical protein
MNRRLVAAVKGVMTAFNLSLSPWVIVKVATFIQFHRVNTAAGFCSTIIVAEGLGSTVTTAEYAGLRS